MNSPAARTIVLHNDVAPDAPPEEQDNLHQVALVREALDRLGHNASALPLARDLDETAEKLLGLRPDLVFNLVESVEGSCRSIHLVPALLEKLGLPFTGCGGRAMMDTTNKLLGKTALRAAGLDTPDWVDLESTGPPERFRPGRFIVKSLWEHASLGLDDSSVVEADSPEALRQAMAKRRGALGGDCLAEAYIDGREFNISLLADGRRPEVLPPAEIAFEGYGSEMLRIVGYRAKWETGTYEFDHTPRVFEFKDRDRDLISRLTEMSLRCWDVFDLHGWARVDFRVDPDGRPWILEVNANPCLSDDAGFIAAAGRWGLDFVGVVARIINDVDREETSRSGGI